MLISTPPTHNSFPHHKPVYYIAAVHVLYAELQGLFLPCRTHANGYVIAGVAKFFASEIQRQSQRQTREGVWNGNVGQWVSHGMRLC